MYNYDNKRFRSLKNSAAGEVGADTIFQYRQAGTIVTATYVGGEIVQGQLIAICNERGELDMRYQYVNRAGQLLTGTCQSIPEQLPSSNIRWHTTWQWTGRKERAVTSIIEEITELS